MELPDHPILIMAIKLFEVWMSRDAWKRLSRLKKDTDVVMPLKRYAASVRAEYALIEEHRNELLIRIAKADPEDREALRHLTIKHGTPEWAEFALEWEKFLSGDSKLKPFSCPPVGAFDLDRLQLAIKHEGNTWSEEDAELLEPFFDHKREVVEETG